MPTTARPTPDMCIEAVLGRWPALLHLFIRWRMACPGCPMARFETLEEAASAYRLDREAFFRAIQEAARPGGNNPRTLSLEEGETT